MQFHPFLRAPAERSETRATNIPSHLGSLSLGQKLQLWHVFAEGMVGYPSTDPNTEKPTTQITHNGLNRTVTVDPEATYPTGYRESAKAYKTWEHTTHSQGQNSQMLCMEEGTYSIDPSTGRSLWRDSSGGLERYSRATRKAIVREEKKYAKLAKGRSHDSHGRNESSFMGGLPEPRRYVEPVRGHNAQVEARKKADAEAQRAMLRGDIPKKPYNPVTNRYVSGLYEPWDKPTKRKRRPSRFTKAKLRKIEPEEGFWF